MSKQNHNPRLLLIISALNAAVEIFIGTFLVAYFLNLSDNNIVPTSLFYIFTYLFVIVTSTIIGPIIKCGPKLLLFRLSFVVNFIIMLLIIGFKENIITYVWLLGMVLGAERILFYFPYNIMISQDVGKKQIISFNGYRSAVCSLVKIIIPVILGWLISVDSFVKTTSFILILQLSSLALSMFIKESKPSCRPFRLKYLMTLAKKRPTISLSLQIDFVKGFTFEVLNVLVVLYVMYMFKTNLNLGIFTSIFALCTVAANIVFGRFCHYGHFSRLLIVCSVLTVAGSLFFVLDSTRFSFIVYNFIYAIATLLIQTITDINTFKVSQDKSVASLYRAEYLTMREIFLNSGRCIGFGLVLVVAIVGRPEMLKYLLMALNILVIVMGWMSVRLSRRLNCIKQ